MRQIRTSFEYRGRCSIHWWTRRQYCEWNGWQILQMIKGRVLRVDFLKAREWDVYDTILIWGKVIPFEYSIRWIQVQNMPTSVAVSRPSLESTYCV